MNAIIGEFKASKIFTSDNKHKVLSMNNPGKAYKRVDEWGNRSGTDRRKHQYAICFPERRSGRDRRK